MRSTTHVFTTNAFATGHGTAVSGRRRKRNVSKTSPHLQWEEMPDYGLSMRASWRAVSCIFIMGLIGKMISNIEETEEEVE